MSRKSYSIAGSQNRFGGALSDWVPVIFLVFVFIFGGGSRSDIMSLPLLRGGAVLFACWAALGLSREDWRRIRIPLILLLASSLCIAIQLIPLPPSMWTGLPRREIIAEIDVLLGQPNMWRAITLTPSETWNSLLAMTVPFAAVLIAGRLTPDDTLRLMLVLVVIAVVSALLGPLQILSGGGAAHFYRITNSESMVGLFANRNHHAVFLACATVVAAMLLRDELMRKRQRKPLQLALAVAALLFTTLTLLIGSRAGLVAGVASFASGYAMVLAVWRQRAGGTLSPERVSSAFSPTRLLAYVPPAFLIGVVATIYSLAARSTSISRVAGNRVAEDLRVLAWPTIREMLETHWVLGSGFGSFPDVYAIFEPDSLLQPSYFNHAHNDWVEIPITGGLPFTVILLVALIWFVRGVAQKGMRNLISGHRGDFRFPVLTVTGLVAAASLVDYPLRVPSMQVMLILLIMILLCLKPVTARRE